MNKDVIRFITTGILFLLPLVASFSYAEYYFRHTPSSYSMKKNNLESQKKDVEVLILGSSHSLFGIDPAHFSLKGFNLANNSQSLFYDSMLTQRYLPELPRLKCVLIEASQFSLGYELNRSPEGWRDYFYYHIWGITYPGLVMDGRAFSYVMLYTPSLALQHLFSDAGNLENIAIEQSGWESTPLTHRSPITDESGKERAHYHEGLVHVENYPKNIAYMQELLDVLGGRGIGAAIISPPVYQTYSRYLNAETILKNEAVWKDLCNGYGCKRFDYTKDTRFGLDDFLDNDHLNAQGAQKFSAILNREVLPSICKSP